MANQKVKSNKKYFIATGIVIVLAVLVATIFLYSFDFSQSTSTKSAAGSGFTEAVTMETLPAFLESTEFVNDLPRNSKINLLVGDNEYMVTKNSVESGSYPDPDVTITVPESYVEQMDNGLCETLSTAWDNGDIGVETSLSNLQLAWKYKGMMKYRSCLNG